MPVYLDPEPRDAVTPAPAPCDWKVVFLMRGRVAPSMAVTFTTATLPQLRQIVDLLEKDQPAS